MVLAALALLLLGCGSPAPAAKPATPAPVAVSKAPAPDLKPAPPYTLYGLTLGKTDDAAMQAWIATEKLTCKADPAVRRKTFRYTCDGDLPVTVLPDRTIKGKLTSLLLVRTDTGPLHHFSTRRVYSIPTDAVTDYNSARSALVATFGEPVRGAPIAADAKLDTKMLWYASEWHFSDLNLTLHLIRAAGNVVAVTESYDTPGVESAVETREGGVDPGGHGAGADGAAPGADPGGHTGGRDPYGFDRMAPPSGSTSAPAPATPK